MDMFSTNYHQPLLYKSHRYTVNVFKKFQDPEFICRFLELRPDYK